MPPVRVEPSARSREIKYAVRDIVLLANQAKERGKELLYLNIGDPLEYDFETPPHLIEAVERAMRNQRNGYSPSSGTAEALEAIRGLAERRGFREVQEVFVTSGGSEAIELALAALVDPGDNVLVPCPGYPLYTAVLPKLSAEARPYFLDEERDWQPDLADLEAKIDHRTRGLVLINPNNPTGAVYTREVLLEILELARRYRLVVFADEIYDLLVYGKERKHVSIATLCDDVVVVTFNGLSKSYLAPGWRIGWGIISGDRVAAAEYAEAVLKFTRARLCASHPMQAAIRPALEGDQSHLEKVRNKLYWRRNLTVQMLNSIDGIHCVLPQAAFYAFPTIELGIDDEAFVHRLIMTSGVVVVPGSGFGQRPGSHHFRVVFLPEEHILQRAFERLAEVAATFRG
ncbi:MAG: aminotransferase [Deltaproteobacteria bacterium RIFOXYA12_FULL_61_11]|nr:MAG: aminotransferase [Deltaproteobacteria bacterium RIFOXYA12_FULL_61_11]